MGDIRFMKVFCNKCKHHKSIERYAMHSVCKLTKFTIDSPTGQTVDWEECDALNVNNSCKKYEEKWFYSFVAKLRNSDSSEPIEDRFELLDL